MDGRSWATGGPERYPAIKSLAIVTSFACNRDVGRTEPGATMRAKAWVRWSILGACVALAGCAASGQTPTAAVQAPQQGSAEAEFKMGVALLMAQPPRPADAAIWLKRAADHGHKDATWVLGERYLAGNGVAANPVEAVRLFKLGADRGSAAAMNDLGLAYENGRGVTQDYAEAAVWYKRAAAWGNSSGANNLGLLYLKGRHVAQNYEAAAEWFDKAVRQGNLVAAFNLGQLYRDGKGVGRSDFLAYIYFNLAAARLGPPTGPAAVQQRDVVAQRLAAADLERAQTMARDWKPGLLYTAADVPAGVGPVTAAQRQPRSVGSGFVVATAGYLVTNQHVVEGCGEVAVKYGDADELKAEIQAQDPGTDLALLKLPRSFPVAAGLHDRVRQGDTVLAFGFPLYPNLSNEGSLTTGTVTALSGLQNDPAMLQVSAPVQPGNSGGPLADLSGNVVGVVAAKLNAVRVAAATGDIPQNVNFAIKATILRDFLLRNGIAPEAAAAGADLKPADVGDRLRRVTALVKCYAKP